MSNERLLHIFRFFFKELKVPIVRKCLFNCTAGINYGTRIFSEVGYLLRCNTDA